MKAVLCVFVSCVLLVSQATTPTDIVKQACYKYYGLPNSNKTTQDCKPNLSNGVAVKPQEFPYMALLGQGDKKDIKYICSAALISDNFLLGSRHCVKKEVKWAKVGGTNFNTGHVTDIEKIITFDETQPTLNNDIALFKLKDKVILNKDIKPACLETSLPPTDQSLVSVGSSDYSTEGMVKSEYVMVPVSACQSVYSHINNISLPQGIEDNTMVCAQIAKDTPSLCQVGVLQYGSQHQGCIQTLVGIASFGLPCQQEDPGLQVAEVFTKVSHFVPWIQSVVWPQQ